MKKFVMITTLVTLAMGGVACSSHERVVKENTERSYSSTATAPLPPPDVDQHVTIERRTTTTTKTD